MTDELIGKNIGGYEITGIVGRGGMSTVYKAQQVSMNRVVALKVLPRHLANDNTYLERFHREVKFASQLEHRSIVPVYDYGEYEGQPYIAMRYLTGGTVDDLLNDGAMPLGHILHILQQIAPALDYAHSKGVLHRDLKPSNVLLDDDRGAYLTDFGIARVLTETADGSPLTLQGVVGTPSYMSPEQAQGHPLDARSDLYSLGVMLFEMATGRRPFEGDTPYGIAVMQVTTPPPMPRAINPNLTPPVEDVLLRSLRKQRDERFNSAVTMVDTLKTAAAMPPVVLSDTQPGFPTSLPRDIPARNPTPVSPMERVQPVVTPPPPRMQTPSMSGPVARVRRRRGPNGLLLSAIIGGIIGCGLLAVLVVVGLLLSQNNEANLRLTATANARTLTASAPTAQAGAVALPTTGATDEVTAPGIGGGLVFFSERSGSYNIYMLDLPTLVEQQLTDESLSDTYPIVSPDGSRVVFQSDRDGDFDLYLMDIDGGNVQRLVQNTVTDRIPAWSPDGQWIAFSSDTRGDGNFDLYRVRPDGSELEALVSNGQRNSHVRWSPDGSYLLFTTGAFDDARTWEIARYDLNTRETTPLTNNDAKDFSPSFSADGQTILYLTEGDGYGAIAAMDADGGNQHIVYDGPGYELSASYSPDGQYIAFTTDVTGRDEIYLMTPDGQNIDRLTENGGHYATWLPQ